MSNNDLSEAEIKEALDSLIADGIVEKIVVDGKESYQLTQYGAMIEMMYNNPNTPIN